MKRTALALIFSLALLVAALAVAEVKFVNLVFGQSFEAVTIKLDGSIDPQTAPITTFDNFTYTFTDNINDSLVIERDSIVVDGAGYIIQGSGSGNGIELLGRNNVTIENVEVRGFYQGILIYNFSRGNNVFSVRTMCNTYGGICVDSSTDNNVTGNMVVGGREGIILSGNGGNNSVVKNNIEGSEFYGMNIISASDNLVKGNNISNCGWHGIRLWMSSCNNGVYENSVSGCKVGIEVSYSSNNNTVSGNSFSVNWIVGVVIGFRIPESGPEWGGAAENRIIGNNVTHNNLGIELIYSKNNAIFYNNIEENNNSVAIIGSYFNIWDDGAMGNHWSDYNGTDANHDGVGETSYIIDENNTDHYPLVTQYIIPEFPISFILPLFMIVTLLAAMVNRRNTSKRVT
jgi:parallel beta-helix repeat protein